MRRSSALEGRVSQKRGADPVGLRLEPSDEVHVSSILVRSSSEQAAAATLSPPPKDSSSTSSASPLNMTQEVQELLQHLQEFRLGRKEEHGEEASSSSPRSTILDDGAVMANSADAADQQSYDETCWNAAARTDQLQLQQQRQSCGVEKPGVAKDPPDDVRWISTPHSFHLLSVIEEDDNEETSSVIATAVSHHSSSCSCEDQDDESLSNRQGGGAEESDDEDSQERTQPQQDEKMGRRIGDDIHTSWNNLPSENNDEEKDKDDAEALLQAAHAERAAATRWAAQLRRAVYQWVQQQKQLVECYQQQRNNNNCSTAAATQQQQLLEKVRRLEHRLQTQENGHLQRETALRAIICEQRAQLETMQKQEMLQPKTNTERTKATRPPGEEKLTQSLQFSTNTTKQLQPKYAGIEAEGENSSSSSTTTTNSSQNRRTHVATEAGQIITYGNGAVKEIHSDNLTIVRFPNGDVQSETADDKAYYFAQSGVIQVTHAKNDAVKEFHYPNGQVEEHWKNGRKSVLYPDGTLQSYDASGTLIQPTTASSNSAGADVSASAVTI